MQAMKNLALFLLILATVSGCKDSRQKPARATAESQASRQDSTAETKEKLEVVEQSRGVEAKVNICGRTEQVKNKILAKLKKTDCLKVTAEDLKGIVVLNLYNQNIADLKAGDFDGLITLKTLYLSHNQLTVFPDGIFNPLIKLKTLALSHNHLTAVPDGGFEPLVSLNSLELDNNRIVIVSEGSFVGLKNLEKLELGNNQLATVAEGAFEPLVSLKKLRLVGNPLTEEAKQRITKEVVPTVTF